MASPPSRSPPSGDGSPVFQFLHGISTASKPLVAAVAGPAVGIGTTMLLHCDFVYAAPNARFQMPFVSLGLVPEAASSLLLPMLSGYHQAAELLLLAIYVHQRLHVAGEVLVMEIFHNAHYRQRFFTAPRFYLFADGIYPAKGFHRFSIDDDISLLLRHRYVLEISTLYHRYFMLSEQANGFLPGGQPPAGPTTIPPEAYSRFDSLANAYAAHLLTTNDARRIHWRMVRHLIPLADEVSDGRSLTDERLYETLRSGVLLRDEAAEEVP